MSWSVSPGGIGPLVGVFGLPDPVYWIPVALLFLGTLGVLYFIQPPVTDWTVPAIAPWIAVGALVHVLRLQSVFPDVLVPLFGTPMLYLTTATLAFAAWSLSELVTEMRGSNASCDRQMAVAGTVVVVFVVLASLVDSVLAGTLRPLWPTLALFGAAVTTGIVWVLVSVYLTETATTVARTGVVVVFAHLLDAITAGIGVVAPGSIPDGIGIQPPLMAAILDAGSGIPVVGGPGLFVVVKLALAVAVVVTFERVVDQRPTEGRLALGVVVAAGLGPALHNVLLYTVSGTIVPV